MIRHYLAVLSRRKFVALTVGIVVFAAIMGLAVRGGPEYQATANALINRQQMDLANSLAGNPTNLEAPDNGRLALTQAGIAQSPTVAARAIQALKLRNVTPSGLLGRIAVAASATTDLLTFTGTGRTEPSAVLLVNTYVREYQQYAEELDTAALRTAQAAVSKLLAAAKVSAAPGSGVANLESRVQQLTVNRALQTGNVQFVAPATTATKTAPKLAQSAVIGVVLGLLVGIAAAFARDAMDNRVRSAAEVIALLDATLLARIGRFPDPAEKLPAATLGGAPAEEFRMLRAALDLADVDEAMPALLIASSVPGEGKTTVAANLAVTMARAGQSVVLVDLDLHRPAVASVFGIDAGIGVTSVASKAVSLETALQRFMVDEHGLAPIGAGISSGASNLAVLPSGPLPPNPGEFVGSGAMRELIDDLRANFGVVIIDGPPVLAVSDPIALSALVDCVLVVARPNLVRRPDLVEASRLLDTLVTRVLGVVVNCDGERQSYTYGTYYSLSQNGSPEGLRAPA